MFEHVGYKNYRDFMEIAHRLLDDRGLFLLHTIGNNTSVTGTDPWIDKHIFPNGQLPSLAQITKSAEGLFVVEDVHNFGADYDRTLMSWEQNFSHNWDRIHASNPENYDERFRRMWEYFLLSCAGLFRARKEQLFQIVLSKDGVPGGYQSVR
jgi:cyclopropane-fatty-acyl-phospholipid synthase